LLGAGLALLFAERLAEHAVAFLVVGIITTHVGCTTNTASSALETPSQYGGQSLYCVHWLALAALLVYVIAANRS
jgi:hypothetical protein